MRLIVVAISVLLENHGSHASSVTSSHIASTAERQAVPYPKHPYVLPVVFISWNILETDLERLAELVDLTWNILESLLTSPGISWKAR